MKNKQDWLDTADKLRLINGDIVSMSREGFLNMVEAIQTDNIGEIFTQIAFISGNGSVTFINELTESGKIRVGVGFVCGSERKMNAKTVEPEEAANALADMLIWAVQKKAESAKATQNTIIQT